MVGHASAPPRRTALSAAWPCAEADTDRTVRCDTGRLPRQPSQRPKRTLRKTAGDGLRRAISRERSGRPTGFACSTSASPALGDASTSSRTWRRSTEHDQGHGTPGAAAARRADKVQVVRATEILGLLEASEEDPVVSEIWQALRGHATLIDLLDEDQLPDELRRRIDAAQDRIWLWNPWVGRRSEQLLPHLSAAQHRGIRVHPVVLPETRLKHAREAPARRTRGQISETSPPASGTGIGLGDDPDGAEAGVGRIGGLHPGGQTGAQVVQELSGDPLAGGRSPADSRCSPVSCPADGRGRKGRITPAGPGSQSRCRGSPGSRRARSLAGGPAAGTPRRSGGDGLLGVAAGDLDITGAWPLRGPGWSRSAPRPRNRRRCSRYPGSRRGRPAG